MKTEEDKGKLMGYSKGILLAMMSGVMLSCITVIVKYLTNIHPGQLAVCRHWATAALTLPPLVWSGENLFGPHGHRSYVTVRAVMTSVSIFSQFLTFRYLPVGEAAVLLSTTPVFVTIAAKFFFKEPFGLLQTISLLTTGTGIILITGLHHAGSDNPRIYTTEDMYGFSAGLLSVLSFTAVYIMTRELKHISFNVLLFTSSIVGIFGSAIATPITGSFTLNYRCLQQILIIVLGLMSYFAIMGMCLSLKYLETGLASTMRYSSDVLLSFLWQIFLFAHVVDTDTIVGALLVFISVLLLVFRNRIENNFSSKQFKACNSSSQ